MLGTALLHHSDGYLLKLVGAVNVNGITATSFITEIWNTGCIKLFCLFYNYTVLIPSFSKIGVGRACISVALL